MFLAASRSAAAFEKNARNSTVTAMNVKGPLKGQRHEHTARNLKPPIDYAHVDTLHGPNFETPK